ncbi:MAG: hypothetical protein GYA30_00880 [Chloroflexi bacterium]|nr:hypothetical protein [Chloroflexota bacterium]
MLVAGCWMLVAGCSLLDAGCWLLIAGCSLLVAGCSLLILDALRLARSSLCRFLALSTFSLDFPVAYGLMTYTGVDGDE